MALALKLMAVCLFLFLCVVFLWHHKKNFGVNRGFHFLFVIFSILNWSFSTWGLRISSHYGALVLFFMIAAELKILYRMNMIQIAFEASYFVAILYWGRGIVVPAFALYLDQSVQWVRYDDFYYYLAWNISLVLILGYNACFRTVIAPKDKMENLYNNKEQLWFVALFQICLVGYLLFINLGRYYGVDLAWYKVTYIISCIVFCMGQIYLVMRGIKTSMLLEYELRSRLLENQLEKQMLHYKSYQKYTESFRTFKHDYKNMMASVKSLLAMGQYEKAERMLDSIHDIMQKQVLVHKTYSNHMILDAVLQDAANLCEEGSIQFSAIAYISAEFTLPDIDLVRIFSNLLDNAVEANAKVLPLADRFISVASSVNSKNGWIAIEISNSFDGRCNVSDGNPETTKEEKEFHGIGLHVIKEIVKGFGGIVKIFPDSEKKVFTVTIALPPKK